MFCECNSTSKIMVIDYTLGKATSIIPYEIFTNTYHGRRIVRKKTDGWRYTILKKKTANETKYNTDYNSRLEVKHFAVSAVGVGKFAASSDLYLIFKHFEFIKHCFMS